MNMRQVEVRREAGLHGSSTERICWVADRPDLAVGKEVTFKGDPARWVILTLYRAVVPLDQINRNWKVGGLV